MSRPRIGIANGEIIVLTIKDILMEGEVFLGDYNMEVARWRDGRWSAMVPPLYVIVTDHRLVLQSTSRKQHDPAIIPASYITEMQSFTFEFRRGVILRLKTGHAIALFIPGLKGDEILRDLHTITAPTSKPKRYKMTLELGDLQKLIDYVSGL